MAEMRFNNTARLTAQTVQNISLLLLPPPRNLTRFNVMGNCSLSANRKFDNNGIPLMLYLATVLSQLFSLLVFHRWPHKKPFIYYHVSLSLSALLNGLTGITNPITRLAAWSDASEVVAKAGAYTSIVFARTNVVNTLFMSVDRWMSVEFAVGTAMPSRGERSELL
ncbi:hypothetical protein BV898_14963 [Hypsibius exemplaris]|uniref:Uncharacterized protein n=1 Tax=Hypsibius exemplaris TaxID=2072580 RepID=A0A9X6RJT0_HYPEX|nr:hypothetical protein BV898_14963 [Hypsibius exemplaris]